MNRPEIRASVRSSCARPIFTQPIRGFTLIEVLMATALTGLLMVGVVEMFAAVGDSVSNSRSILEVSGRLRETQARLQMDLEGITVTMLPPRRPGSNEGYAEFREGPIGPFEPRLVFANRLTAGNLTGDMTVNDIDDILMFTTRSKGRPFVGRVAGFAEESDVAEVAWFVRGTTLYRRVLLVAPRFQPGPGVQQDGFYRDNDLSVHFDGTNLVANTLADLTKRECRFAHDPDPRNFPGDPHATGGDWPVLGLPTLCECSSDGSSPATNAWLAGDPMLAVVLANNGNPLDYWENPLPYSDIDQSTGALIRYYNAADPQPGQRIAEDVILTNVIGFDLQVWDPGAPVIGDPNGNLALGPADVGYRDALNTPGWDIVSYGAYVDLGYDNVDFNPNDSSGKQFHHTGDPRSGNLVRIYDTWSTHYEHDGVDQDEDGEFDEATDGFDSLGINDLGPNNPDEFNGVIDDAGERETSAPYPVPLRGIRVKIRVFEPDSRQIREVTVVQDFLPK